MHLPKHGAKRRVLLLIRSLNIGGTERQTVELAVGLRRKGNDVVVVTMYPDGPLEQDLRKGSVFPVSLKKRGRWDVVGSLWRLIMLIKRQRPAVIYCFLNIPNIFGVVAKIAFPRVRLVWGIRSSYVDLRQYDWLAAPLFRLECFLARFADLIVANSNAGRDYYVAHRFPEERIVVIPNGINVTKFRPDAGARARIRGEWGVLPGEKLIGMVSRFDPAKDHVTFLKAATALVHEAHDARFVLIGDGPELIKKEIAALAASAGLSAKLIWAGSREDMADVYNALDIMTSCSIGEGFPNTVGEAMASGVQCIVTDVGDSARIVGDTGLVVPVRSPQALADGWLTMLGRLTSEPGAGAKRSRQRIVENFSVERMVSATESALGSLVR